MIYLIIGLVLYFVPFVVVIVLWWLRPTWRCALAAVAPTVPYVSLATTYLAMATLAKFLRI